ncbi:hypothetical protein TcG_03015 [Trypanosoma cruzi]|uniref:Eukaryotic translation initiation factor 3 subunit h n=2 Tax=Trypanosoma cruzi TaxID=5693 RepID=V5BNS6_TRYCR|nr:hypothetical protein TCDM_01711 [Trypanosoma cruzi Dm28c]PBJ74379.1 hypothetical protein BCY84_12628 [Trypanosoma cruzi cruzi]PWU91136.1 eukaryotic translation initiation factor 3 subunit h [Trypanosoma cruzi]RNF21388.1 hypothetical protein TcG_03015 [Trypanosoma cruzi]
MFHGFPDVQIAPRDTVISEEFHLHDKEGRMGTLLQPMAQRMRISFSALTCLGSYAQNATCHYALFGRLCGVQLNETIEVTNVLPPVINPRPPEDETPEQREKRLLAQQREERQMYERMGKMFFKEELDSYHVGYFAICSAYTNAPYSVRTVQQLAQLALDGNPSVLVVYDPFRTSLMGKLYLRAFVPTREYVEFYTRLIDKRNILRENRLMRECNVGKGGVLREVKVEVDVDEYQLLCLSGFNVAPLSSTCRTLHSEVMTDYMAALIESVRHNADELSRGLHSESYFSQKEESYGPLGQRIDTLLKLMQLREQTQHLESLCDGVLINTSLLRDL